MKTRILILLFTLSAMPLLNGCDEDITSVDFDVILSQDFPINEPTGTTWEKDTVIDASAQSDDISTYSDRIEQVTVQKVTYQLTFFAGDSAQVMTHGEIYIGDPNGGNMMTLAEADNVTLLNLLNNETILPVQQATVSQIMNYIKNAPHKMWAKMEGTVNAPPTNLIVKVKFYLKIKAKVL